MPVFDPKSLAMLRGRVMTDEELSISRELIAYLCKGDRVASEAGTLTLRVENAGRAAIASADDGTKVERFLISIVVRKL